MSTQLKASNGHVVQKGDIAALNMSAGLLGEVVVSLQYA